MEFYKEKLCIPASMMILSNQNPDGILTKDNYDKLCQRGWLNVLRRGCNGNPALIEYDTMPLRYKAAFEQKFGDPKQHAQVKPFIDRIVTDHEAASYFSNYILADGRNLPDDIQREYCTNANVLNAIKVIFNSANETRKALSGSKMKGFWGKAIEAVNAIRVETKHTLPSKEIPLKRRYLKYVESGYEALISGKFCNDNSRKVTDDLERLIMSLYTMPEKPFAKSVHALYTEFLEGKITVADRKTGEIFNPTDYVKNGKPLELTAMTVWLYLNKPENRIIVDKARSGSHRFNSAVRPHHHRKAPNYSFSKITMDDRALPRKCVNGKWVSAYYAYDVTSGCVIGYSYSFDKNERLFIDCLQDMFRLIDREGFGMPLQVEVENHLVNKFFDDLEMMFPFVRICNPGNSQEKHAEHLNRQKKYGIEKKTQHGIGRWWSRHEAYTVDRDKVNDEFVEKMYTYERLVADDVQACKDFNNQLHPKQKKYPGKTRWQVLAENMNPDAKPINKAIIYKGIGEKTLTTIRRNQYVTVQHAKYQLSNLDVLQKLKSGNYNVEAYYLPDTEGMISDVYLWQNGEFLCKAAKIVEYNTAKAEWTEADHAAYTEQAKYVSEFDAKAKQGKKDLAAPVIIKSETLKEAIQAPVKVVEPVPVKGNSIDDILSDYNADDFEQKAIDDI